MRAGGMETTEQRGSCVLPAVTLELVRQPESLPPRPPAPAFPLINLSAWCCEYLLAFLSRPLNGEISWSEGLLLLGFVTVMVPGT